MAACYLRVELDRMYACYLRVELDRMYDWSPARSSHFRGSVPLRQGPMTIRSSDLRHSG
jgi:hypothetical protein